MRRGRKFCTKSVREEADGDRKKLHRAIMAFGIKRGQEGEQMMVQQASYTFQSQIPDLELSFQSAAQHVSQNLLTNEIQHSIILNQRYFPSSER